ncbi:Peroxisomal biogenesis factor 11 (PEX11) family protein [Leishmania donovani]|uniref:Peroxisomal biogenesis factor 11 (PEX11) family protein n=1 Tax=Leishmania donovani TaxID=5661 RepID=A0A504X1J3_LEIDO|nr:Peroxisomal biogenesis factor 11 (PEX11) family protein [Leishmania donovani]
MMVQEVVTGEALRVLGRNPFEGITTKTRLRQLLQTHQGRDKLFKVAQYLLRIRLWWNSVDFNVNYVPGENFSRMEKNLMTIVNSRRMFRLGRFFGEFVRMRVTLIKASELVYIPVNGGQWGFAIREVLLEDVAFLVQKGFFHSNVAGRLIYVATRCGLPVLTIDLFLNTLRLYQGILDASATESSNEIMFSKDSFSLLSKYDRVDKLRRKLASTTDEEKLKEVIKDQQRTANGTNENVVYVESYAQLLWTDFELHWICVTEAKLLLDIFVALSGLRGWKLQGSVSTAGLLSGLCSIYRVWTYGR